jgi:CHASE3 domain sensor protein
MTKARAMQMACLAAVLLSTLSILGLAGWLVVVLVHDRSIATEIDRRYNQIFEARRFELLMREAEAYQREYIISGDEISLVKFREALQAVHAGLTELQSQARGDYNRVERLHSITGLAEYRIARLTRTADERATRGLEAALQLTEPYEARQLMEGLRFNLAWIQHEEEARIRALRFVKEKNTRHALAGVLGLAALALAALGWVVVAPLSSRDVRRQSLQVT